MARDTKDVDLRRMPRLLNDLLNMRNIVTGRNGEMFRESSRTNCSSLLPVLITAEERDEIQKDRQKAVEYEEKLARRKQEKYFDLVDQVGNVLRRIEEKKSRKEKLARGNTFVDSQNNNSLSINYRNLESNDFNNNPSLKKPDFEVSSDYNGHTMVRQNVPSCHETPEQNTGYRRVEKSGRYSLPADSSNHFINHDGYSESITKQSQGKTNGSVLSDHPSLYSISLSNTSTLRQSPTTQMTTSSHSVNSMAEAQTWTSVSSITADTQSRNNHSAMEQKRMLAFEQKRLEEHFGALQGQLMVEFQQQQNELLQSYKQSVELESITARESFHSNVERKSTPNSDRERKSAPHSAKSVHNSGTKDKYDLLKTDEFPQSPFSLSPKRKSSPSQKFAPGLSVTVKSFNSEASAQEFCDLSHFGERNEDGRNRKKGWAEGSVESEMGVRMSPHSLTTEKKSVQSFGVEMCTSPKYTKLNSFEPKTKDMKNHKFVVLSAHAKGFLTRRLFQTEKIISFVMTVKDARIVLNEMETEASQSMTDRSFKERVETQLHHAQDELRHIFMDSSPRLRMHILEQNRKLLKEKQDRNDTKTIANAASQSRPRLSSVTMKKRMSRQEIDVKRPLKSSPSASTAIKTTVVSKETPSPKRVEKHDHAAGKASIVPPSKAPCVTTSNVTTSSVTRSDVKKVVNTRTSAHKVTKVNNNKVKRRTWDNAALKPIQGRISPTLPNKAKSSEVKRKSTLSTTTTKTDHKHDVTQGTSGTSGNIRVDSRTYKLNNRPTPVTRPGAKRSLAANLSIK